MPECGNCESFVSSDYTRVFSPEGEDQVQCCPDCPDRVRASTYLTDEITRVKRS